MSWVIAHAISAVKSETPHGASSARRFRMPREDQYKHDAGDTAIDEGYFVGTNTVSMTGPNGETIPATGRRVRLRECDVVTVENGVVTSHRFYFDVQDWLTQLGLAPESPA